MAATAEQDSFESPTFDHQNGPLLVKTKRLVGHVSTKLAKGFQMSHHTTEQG
jgi:hypothetical protein